MKHFYYFLILIVFIFGCSRQSKNIEHPTKSDSLTQKPRKEYDSSIYIGLVTGSTQDAFFKKYAPWKDSIFRLPNLVNSTKLIEIRFFTTNYWSDTGYCIILEYDSLFKIRGLKHYNTYLENIKVEANPDSIFEKLVENGIFSINTPNVQDVYPVVSFDDFNKPSKRKVTKQNYPLYELTKKGFKEGTIVGPVVDGVSFMVVYKVNNLFDDIFIDNPGTYFSHNPDFQIARRKFEITRSFLSGLK